MRDIKKIYLASSWRNRDQQDVVSHIRMLGHDVYDFKQLKPGHQGFLWSEMDEAYSSWNAEELRNALLHPAAMDGFRLDFAAMNWADTFVMLLPCGKSSHLEAGWAIGMGKPTYFILNGCQEPELMYKLATGIFSTINGFYEALQFDEIK